MHGTVPRICFTSNLSRHVNCPEQTIEGDTVAAALETAFAAQPTLRNYILDERGALRAHMAILVNGKAIRDRETLGQSICANDEIHVLQALSGG